MTDIFLVSARRECLSTHTTNIPCCCRSAEIESRTENSRGMREGGILGTSRGVLGCIVLCWTQKRHLYRKQSGEHTSWMFLESKNTKKILLLSGGHVVF